MIKLTIAIVTFAFVGVLFAFRVQEHEPRELSMDPTPAPRVEIPPTTILRDIALAIHPKLIAPKIEELPPEPPEAALVEPTEDEWLWINDKATAAYKQQLRIARQVLADQPWVSNVVDGDVYASKGFKGTHVIKYDGLMWVQEYDGNYLVREKSFPFTHPTGRLLHELEKEIK